MTAKNILKIVPGLQATSILARNIPKNFKMKPLKKIEMKKSTKNIIKIGALSLIGIALIKPTSKLINDL